MRDLNDRGWFETPATKRRLAEVEGQALLDGYAKTAIYDTVSITELELQEEFRRWNTKISARYLYSETEKGSRRLKERLEQGETFEELARVVFRDPGLASNGGSVGFFGKGDMEPSFEEAAMGLSVGELSNPVKIGIGYAIIRVDEKKLLPLLSESDYARQKGDIEAPLRERKNKEAIQQVSRQIGEELNPRYNDRIVELLFEGWQELTSGAPREAANRSPRSVSLKDSLLVSFSEGEWTVGQFVARIDKLTEKQQAAVRSPEHLRDAIAGLRVRVELLNRAQEAGLGVDLRVQEQINSVTLQLALKEWARQIEDSLQGSPVDEGLILNIFRENFDRFVIPPQISVAEILVRTQDEANDLLKAVREGADFARLARQRSIRLWAAKQGGELGYKSPAEYGALGAKFVEARVGEIIGPEFVDPYYGIFKIMGRRESRPMTVEEARPQILEGLHSQQMSEAVGKAIGSLRRWHPISIDDALLQSIPLVNPDS
jgi:parvulin-like peptidyl-prolyl isomerase